MVSISDSFTSWFEIGREIAVVMMLHQNTILRVLYV